MSDDGATWWQLETNCHVINVFIQFVVMATEHEGKISILYMLGDTFIIDS